MDLIYYSKGFEALSRVYFQLIKRKEEKKKADTPKTPLTGKSDKSDFFLKKLMKIKIKMKKLYAEKR